MNCKYLPNFVELDRRFSLALNIDIANIMPNRAANSANMELFVIKVPLLF